MKNLKVMRIIIIVCIALIILIPLLICGGIFMLGMAQGIVDIANNEIALNNTAEYIENSTNYAENTTENIVKSRVEESPYKNYTSWYANDIHTCYDEDWTTLNYILVRVETQEGDLEEGNYLFETDDVGASFLVYVVDDPISDLGTYDGEYHMIMKGIEDIKETYTTELKKGQYVYILQGYNKKSSMHIKKLDTN